MLRSGGVVAGSEKIVLCADSKKGWIVRQVWLGIGDERG